MISPQFFAPLCVLVGLALVPTWIHSYADLRVADGLAAGEIPFSLEGFSSTSTSRRRGWGKDKFASDDWIERKYTARSDEVVLTVVRSYDLKKLYHHPELAVAYGIPFVQHQVARVTAVPTIPIHVLRPASATGLGMYVLHYDGRFIEDPIRFQLRTAGELLFTRRKAMTLFFAYDPAAPHDAEIGTLGSATLLLAAVDSFLAQ